MTENILDAARIRAFFDGDHGEFDRFQLQVERRIFEDQSGNTEALTATGIDAASLKTVYYLVRELQPAHTIETGFGHGLSAMAILLGKAGIAGQKHISIDPGNDIGRVVQGHIDRTYQGSFERIYEPSEMALPALLRNQPDLRIRFALIDGNHHFDGALVDFFYLDRFCAIGGCILVDDINAPALETLINFISANKANYRVQEFGRFTVLKKVDEDRRVWSHFRPFVVPNRRDWEKRPRRVGHYLKRGRTVLTDIIGRFGR